MKLKLYIVALLAVYALALGACHLTPEQRQQLGASAIGTVASADTNGDGRVSSDEVRAAPGNLNFIGGALNTLLLLLGGGGAVGAYRANKTATVASARADIAERENARLRAEVDELYDKTIAKG